MQFIIGNNRLQTFLIHPVVKKKSNGLPPKRSNAKFLFRVDAMKLVYTAIFLKKLQILLSKDLLQTKGIAVEKQMRQARFKKWNVYAKSPFGSVASVVEYLGRYTHKVAITKHRFLSITEHSVTFKYKDYRDGSKQKTMPLSIADFLRRFELHFLPRGFVKIRHYGFLQNHGKMARLNAVRTQMKLQALPPKINVPVAVRMLEQYGRDITLCPTCKTGHLQLVAILYPKDIAVKFKLPAALSKTVPLKNKASP